MKKINALTLTSLLAVLMLFAFSATFAVASDATFKRVPGAQHKLLFPDGHDIPSTGCYYDEEEDVYFCSFVPEGTKGVDETAFKKVPAEKHKAKFPKGHDTGIPCFYDEEEAVYFCSYAEQ